MVPLREGFSKGVRLVTRMRDSSSCTTSISSSLSMRRAPHIRLACLNAFAGRSCGRHVCITQGNVTAGRQMKALLRSVHGAKMDSLHVHGRLLLLPFMSCRMFSSSRKVFALVRYCVIHADDEHKLPEYESCIPSANDGHTVWQYVMGV
jgi:hypothetical protein